MKLQFVAPTLSDLDAVEADVLACTVWRDVRPCQGVAGLCDWRFAGRISGLMQRRLLEGRRGEVLLVPGRPRMTFEKLLFVGCGDRGDFDENRYLDALHRTLDAIAGLACRVSVLQLPGRDSDLIRPERAADLLLEALIRRHAFHESWTLVEDLDARRRIEQHMIEERRRIRTDAD